MLIVNNVDIQRMGEKIRNTSVWRCWRWSREKLENRQNNTAQQIFIKGAEDELRKQR